MVSPSALKALTEDAVQAWTGDPKIFARGQGYACDTVVTELVWSPDGAALIATVHGSEDYTTRVSFDARGVPKWPWCSCPYDWGPICKHAVAVLLHAIDLAQHDHPIPIASPSDLRLLALSYDPDDLAPPLRALHARLDEAPHEALVALVVDLAARFPEVHAHLIAPALQEAAPERAAPEEAAAEEESARLIGSRMAELVERIDAILETLDNDAWYLEESCLDDGELVWVEGAVERLMELGADSQALFDRLTAIFDAFDALEGACFGADRDSLMACLELMFVLLSQSAQPLDERVAMACALALDTWPKSAASFEAFCDGLEAPVAFWAQVTQRERQRLMRAERFSQERLALVVSCARRADVELDLIALYRDCAELTGDPTPLVIALLEAGRAEEALPWVAPEGHVRSMGYAQRQLYTKTLRALDDRSGLARVAAASFFEHASWEGFVGLREAAGAAECWARVEPWALHFLRTGRRLDQDDPSAPPWPLLDVDMTPGRFSAFPSAALIQLALEEGRVLDALAHYEAHGGPEGLAQAIAAALTPAHPEAAAAVWVGLAKVHIEHKKASSYEIACVFLVKARDVWLAHGKRDAWDALVGELRQEHRRKSSFLSRFNAIAAPARGR